MKESDLYEPVKEWLEDKGWDVYAECGITDWGGRADVVGLNKPAVCVVEMKTSLTMDLIEQAVGWKRYAHYIYIAIPRRKKQVPMFVQKILRKNRIGLLEVEIHPTDPEWNYVREDMQARFNRPMDKNSYEQWDKRLTEHHKTWVKGGNAGGGYVTQYRLTIHGVKEYLESTLKADNLVGFDGWVPLDEILAHCETHYSRPKPSLSAALRNFENDWCEYKQIGRKAHFRIKEKEGVVL